MGLSFLMHNQSRIRIEPFGAFYAVVSTKTRKVLNGLGLLELLQVLG
jgi:hypothetical protein